MLAIGNDEIEKLPILGFTVVCWRCGKKHRVKFGDLVLSDGTKEPSNLFAYFKCKKTAYMCGIDGKEWRPKEV